MRPSKAELWHYLRAAPGGAALPTFLTIGAPQAGSTWLYENLRLHPEIHIPWKEMCFWSRHPSAPVWLYSRAFHQKAPVRGEITPHYGTLRPEVVHRIRRILGEIKLLILIRDPLFRAWSSARRRQCFDLDSVRHFMTQSKLPYPGPNLDFGNYSKVLHRWLSLFDRDSLHVVWFPDIIERPAEVIGEVLDHVGAAPERFPWGSLKLSKVNSNPTCDIPPDVHEFLSAWYWNQSDHLAEVLGRAPAWD